MVVNELSVLIDSGVLFFRLFLPTASIIPDGFTPTVLSNVPPPPTAAQIAPSS